MKISVPTASTRAAGRRCAAVWLIQPLMLAAVLRAGGVAVYAQSAGMAMGAEMQRLEQSLERSNLSGSERYTALTHLAHLQQLAGNIEGAAQNWLNAAVADPARGGDPEALIAGAYCLAAMGEWGQAGDCLRPLLRTGGQGPLMSRARYLEAALAAWNSGDVSALAALAANPAYVELRPLVYYTLWKTLAGRGGVSGEALAAEWKTRLLAEFPKSPEGRIAAAEGRSTQAAISAAARPIWLLLPGRDFEPPESRPLVPGPAPMAAPPAPVEAASGKVLQTGLYKNEANARVQMEQLREAGFSPIVFRRNVNGNEYWAVGVPSGADMNRSMQELKNAGFDSFPQ